MECGICYSYQLEGEIPEKICEDSRCAQPFHSSCLIEVISVYIVTSLLLSVQLQYFVFKFFIITKKFLLLSSNICTA